jgi:ABC-2 type transport system permease protein
MSLWRTWALIRKELRHIRRDYQILFMVLVAPAFVLFLLTYTFAADLEQIRIGVMDQDHSPSSRRYVHTLTSDDELLVMAYPTSYAEIEALLRRGRTGLVVVIPVGFHADLTAGRPTVVQFVLDGSNYHESDAYRRNVEQRTRAWAAMQGGAGASSASIMVHTRPLYNLPMSWIDGMTPGLMALAFTFPAIAVALACARETEQGSYEGLLSTPIRPIEYLLGKLVPYLVLGVLGTLLAWAVARWWFGVPFRGTIADFVLLASVFMLALMGLGILVGSVANSQRLTIIVIVLIFFIPSFFLSGLLIPLEAGSLTEQILIRALPAANYVDMNRSLFLKGAEIGALRAGLVNLLWIAGVSLLASLLLAKRRVA